MTRRELAAELRAALESLDDAALSQELAPILPADELVGLPLRIRAAIVRVAERLESTPS